MYLPKITKIDGDEYIIWVYMNGNMDTIFHSSLVLWFDTDTLHNMNSSGMNQRKLVTSH